MPPDPPAVVERSLTNFRRLGGNSAISRHPLAESIRAALADGPLTRRALRDRLGIRAESLGEAVHQLLQGEQLRLVGDKLDLP